MLWAYVDVTGTDTGTAICSLAGFVAPAQVWASFTAEWKRIVDDAGVRHFHADECDKCKELFAGKQAILDRPLIPIAH